MVNADADQPYSGRIADGGHRFALRVYFEDTDAGGVVYHANYIGFMERARSDMLACAGIDQRRALEAGDGVYVVAEVNIRYRRPARLGDALLILSRVGELRSSAAVIHQRVMRGDELVADADVRVVFVDAQGKPRRQPAEWVAAFERLQGVS